MNFNKNDIGKIVRVNAGTVFDPSWVNRLHNTYGWIISTHNDTEYLVLFPETELDTPILIHPLFLEEVTPKEWKKVLARMKRVLNGYEKFRLPYEE